MIVEQIDKKFLNEHFSDNDGNLFKNIGWSQLEWLGNNPDNYKTNFELKTNETEDDWTDFINLMDIITEPDPDLLACFNVSHGAKQQTSVDEERFEGLFVGTASAENEGEPLVKKRWTAELLSRNLKFIGNTRQCFC